MIKMIIGFMGMFLILFAFFMNQTHKWKTEYPIYDFVNLIGALLLLIYSYLIKSWPFLVLNLVWAAVSVREAYIDMKIKKKVRKRKKKAGLGHKRK